MIIDYKDFIHETEKIDLLEENRKLRLKLDMKNREISDLKNLNSSYVNKEYKYQQGSWEYIRNCFLVNELRNLGIRENGIGSIITAMQPLIKEMVGIQRLTEIRGENYKYAFDITNNILEAIKKEKMIGPISVQMYHEGCNSRANIRNGYRFGLGKDLKEYRSDLLREYNLKVKEN